MVDKSVFEVAKYGLCTGCGACVGICPVDAVSMIWDEYQDFVAKVDEEKCINCGKCQNICPGAELDYKKLNEQCKLQKNDKFQMGVGDSKSVSVLYTKDNKSFKEGTSGGVVREILASLLEENEIDEVLHITDNEKPLSFPFFAPSTLMNDPDEIRYHKVHSRYCPAPLLTALNKIKTENKRYAVVCLPCHTHALRKLQAESKEWKERIKVIVGLLCSGTPTGAANRYLFESSNVNVDKLVSLDYRHGKWPKGVIGFEADGTQHLVRNMGGMKEQSRLFQMIGVAYMSPFFWRRRCMMCADFYNLYADVCCADPWVKAYWKNSVEDGIPGGTLTITRSEFMEKFVRKLINEDKLGVRMKLDEKAPEETMGKFQTERVSFFDSLKKVVTKNGMKFPIYKNCDLGDYPQKTFNANYRLKKAKIAKNKKLWFLFKYVALTEEVYAFFLRKIGVR